jgi:ABC-2 type transport system permease protein
MKASTRRIRAIVRKEFREYRRHGSVLVATAIFPLIFLIQPILVILRTSGEVAATLGGWHLLLYMLAIPVFTPAVLAAYSVAGERQQGSLEPVLATPIPREEFLSANLAAWCRPWRSPIPCTGLHCVRRAGRAAGRCGRRLRGPDIVAQVLLTPLLAAWSIWVGIAISTRSSDVRVAQQLTLLADIPVVLLTSLIAFDVIEPSRALAIGLIALLVIADVLGWRIVAPMFDRERLITGTR